MHVYRNKSLAVLITLLIVFMLVFVYTFVQLQREIAVFQIGLGYMTENWIIMVLSVLAMMRIVYDIYLIEHHDEYEERVRDAVEEEII